MLEKIIKKTNITDIFIILISAIAIVSIWRGIWGLMDIYLIPENYLFSHIASFLFGIIVLLIISKIR